jgi:rubredoxin
MDNSWLMVAVLFATVLLRLALVLGVIWALIPTRRRCPRCGEDYLSAVSSRVAGFLGLQWRWCLACGWEGLSRRPRPSRARMEHASHTKA